MIIEQMLVREYASLVISMGEIPKKTYRHKGISPITRMAIGQYIERFFYDPHQDAPQELKGMIHAVKKGNIPVMIRANRADDIMTAIQLKHTHRFQLIIAHATDAFLIKDVLKKAKMDLI